MSKPAASLQARLFWAFALITLIGVMVPVYLFSRALYQDRIDATVEDARHQALFAQIILESDPDQAQIERLFSTAAALSMRMTLVDAQGFVLRDSHLERAELEGVTNHADRPEIMAAVSEGWGVSRRYSHTLGIDAVYAALKLRNGDILRLAAPLADIRQHLLQLLPYLFGVTGAVLLFCLLLSALVAARVRQRMDDLAEVVTGIAAAPHGLGRRVHNAPWREMTPLAVAVNQMADTIEDYVATTSDQTSQLETILDSMAEGVLVLGPRGGIRRWNKALAALFPDIEQARDLAVIAAIAWPALQNRVDEVLADQGTSPPPAREPIHFEMPAGRFLVADVSKPATVNAGLGAVLVIGDVTETMRLERVRRDFVSNVSHELRTPLTVIAGYAETLAASDNLGPDQRKFVGIINKHVTALAGVINNLLALARIENLEEDVALRPTNAQEAAGEALAAIRDTALAKRLQIRLDLDCTPVWANPSLLTQVFRNLLENACRYTPPEGEIAVSSRQDNGQVLFTVSDSGPGIPEHALPRIFERFYQVSQERNSGGAGIGLAICKHIIERHQGRIWAQSPYRNTGTAILFTLRAAPQGLQAEQGRVEQP